MIISFLNHYIKKLKCSPAVIKITIQEIIQLIVHRLYQLVNSSEKLSIRKELVILIFGKQNFSISIQTQPAEKKGKHKSRNEIKIRNTSNGGKGTIKENLNFLFSWPFSLDSVIIVGLSYP